MELPETATPKQVETVGNLHSIIEDLEVEQDIDFPMDLIFAGQGQDGPCLGYIKPDGTVSWLVEA